MDKKQIEAVAERAKEACKLVEENPWIIDFTNWHIITKADSPSVFVRRDAFHELFEEYETKMGYHYSTVNGVLFYCIADKEAEA